MPRPRSTMLLRRRMLSRNDIEGRKTVAPVSIDEEKGGNSLNSASSIPSAKVSCQACSAADGADRQGGGACEQTLTDVRDDVGNSLPVL